jgi:hypothetical protein
MGLILEALLQATATNGCGITRPPGQRERLAIVAGLLRDAPPGAGPRLLWREVSGDVRVHALDRELSIGRAEGCTVLLPQMDVSRRHCRVFCSADGWWLEDVGSANGTLINGQPLGGTAYALRDGDLIQLGGAALAVDMPDPGA